LYVGAITLVGIYNLFQISCTGTLKKYIYRFFYEDNTDDHNKATEDNVEIAGGSLVELKYNTQ